MDDHEKRILLRDSDFYKKDRLGLKKLVEQGKVAFVKAKGDHMTGHSWYEPEFVDFFRNGVTLTDKEKIFEGKMIGEGKNI